MKYKNVTTLMINPPIEWGTVSVAADWNQAVSSQNLPHILQSGYPTAREELSRFWGEIRRTLRILLNVVRGKIQPSYARQLSALPTFSVIETSPFIVDDLFNGTSHTTG